MRRVTQLAWALWWIANGIFVLGMIAPYFGQRLLWFDPKYRYFALVYLVLSFYLVAVIFLGRYRERAGRGGATPDGGEADAERE